MGRRFDRLTLVAIVVVLAVSAMLGIMSTARVASSEFPELGSRGVHLAWRKLRFRESLDIYPIGYYVWSYSHCGGHGTLSRGTWSIDGRRLVLHPYLFTQPVTLGLSRDAKKGIVASEKGPEPIDLAENCNRF